MDTLLFGQTGLLGQALYEHFTAVAGWSVDAPSRHRLDVTNLTDLDRYIGDWYEKHPDGVVINCTGLTDVDLCEDQHMQALRMNALLPGFMAQFCHLRDSRFVHIGTDHAFGDHDGRVSYRHPDEDHVLDPRWMPVSMYGRSKAEGEKAALLYGNAIVARTQWLYGDGKPTWVDQVAQNLLAGEPVQALEDYIGIPTRTSDIAVALKLILEQDLPGGTVNLISRGEPASRLKIARFIADTLACDQGLITAITMDDLRSRWKAKRPAWSGLASTNRLTMPDWSESLQQYLRDQHAVKQS